jgi:hypothetical protein
MAALIPKTDPESSAASPDTAATTNGTAGDSGTAGSDRDVLQRDLARALARTAAREAWALACLEDPHDQETIP